MKPRRSRSWATVFLRNPKWSPDGKRISYLDNSWSLYVLDIEGNRCEKICSEPKYGPPDIRGLHHNWSADSKWIVYTVNTDALIQQVLVYNVAENTSYPITDGLSEVSEPCFDPSGKYLYFLASTDSGPVKHWFAMSNDDVSATNQIYLAVLRDSDANPLAKESDEETEKKDETATKSTDQPSDATAQAAEAGVKSEKPETANDKADKKVPTPEVSIDFDGLDQRIVAVPMPAALHSNLQAGNDGTFFVIKQDADGKRSLVSFSLKTRKPTTLIDSDVNGFELTANRKKLLYSGGSNWAIADAGSKIETAKGKLNTDAIQVRVDPRAEWQQIFDEVWRINRDYFYDPAMHGAELAGDREKYKQFLPHCVTRDDLNRVLMWMCSELSVGHHRVGGGDDITTAETVPGGYWGPDYVIDSNRYRLQKVFGGLNWNGDLRAPLTEPGVRVKAGEFILAINGIDLKASDNIFRTWKTPPENRRVDGRAQLRWIGSSDCFRRSDRG